MPAAGSEDADVAVREGADVAPRGKALEGDEVGAEACSAQTVGKRKRKLGEKAESKRSKQSSNGGGTDLQTALRGRVEAEGDSERADKSGKDLEGPEERGDGFKESAPENGSGAEPCGTARESLLRRRKAKRERKKALQTTPQGGKAS